MSRTAVTSRFETTIVALCVLLATPAAHGQSTYALIGTDAQSAGPQAWSEGATAGERFQRVLETWAMGGGLHGVVAARFAGEPTDVRGFGWASAEHRIPHGPATRLGLGLFSMEITAATIGVLAHAERLNLDDPIGAHVDELAADVARVTIRNLLGHRSGLAQEVGGTGPLWAAEVIEAANAAVRDGEPGEHYAFAGPTTLDYLLLAVLVERVTGRSFEVVAGERVLAPLGMNDSGFLYPTRLVPRLATAYHALFGELLPLSTQDHLRQRGVATAYATAGDAMTFLRRVTRERALGDEAVEAVRAGAYIRLTDENGEYSVARDDGRGGVDVYYTDSWIGGYSAFYVYFPQTDQGCVVLSNVERAAQGYAIRRQCARLALGLPVGLPLPKVAGSLWRHLRGGDVEAAVTLHEAYAGKNVDLPTPDELMHHVRALRPLDATTALDVAEFFARVAPERFIAHFERGETLRVSGRIEEAASAYGRALELDPEPVWRRRIDAALTALERASRD